MKCSICSGVRKSNVSTAIVVLILQLYDEIGKTNLLPTFLQWLNKYILSFMSVRGGLDVA